MVSIVVATAVTGLVFLAVALFMIRGREWRSYEFSFGRERESPADVIARWATSPTTLVGGFLVLVLGTALLSMAAIGAIPISVPPMAAVAAAIGVLFIVGVVVGTYGFLRSLDRSTAEASFVSILVLGGLSLAFLSANLIFGILG